GAVAQGLAEVVAALDEEDRRGGGGFRAGKPEHLGASLVRALLVDDQEAVLVGADAGGVAHRALCPYEGLDKEHLLQGQARVDESAALDRLAEGNGRLRDGLVP